MATEGVFRNDALTSSDPRSRPGEKQWRLNVQVMRAAAQAVKERGVQEVVAKLQQGVQGAWHTVAGPGAADEAGAKGKQAEGREHELLEGEGYTGRGRI